MYKKSIVHYITNIQITCKSNGFREFTRNINEVTCEQCKLILLKNLLK
jgi:hypothetical protein